METRRRLAAPRDRPILLVSLIGVMAPTDHKALRRPSCPICGKPTDQQRRPFCSKRCADIDLHRWLSGVYAVPVIEDDDIVERDIEERDGGERDGDEIPH